MVDGSNNKEEVIMIKTLIQILEEEAQTKEWLREFLDKFNETYQDPTYSGEMCDLCGVRVARHHLHNDWHRNLSMGMAMSVGISINALKEAQT